MGTAGAVAALDKGRGRPLPCPAGLGVDCRRDISSFISISFGFQSLLKETIGRPGLSETIVGVGSFALLSFSRNPVAARMSSLRISLPSFILTSGSFSASDLTVSSGLGLTRVFNVYAALRDCVGGLFWISYRSNRFDPRTGSVFDLTMLLFLANWTRLNGFRLICMGSFAGTEVSLTAGAGVGACFGVSSSGSS